MKDKLHLLMTNLSWEEGVIKEYWRQLSACHSDGRIPDSPGSALSRLKRLADIAQKLERRRMRITADIFKDLNEPASQRGYEGLYRNLTATISTELNSLKEALLILRDQVSEHNSQAEELIARSQQVLLETSKSGLKYSKDHQIPQGELVC